jgi:hypothetical protein
MWLAHYSFHFFSSFEGILPVMQRFAADVGWTALGEPQWACACCKPVADWLPRLEIVFLDLGLLMSLYSGYRIAGYQTERAGQAFRAFLPWGVVILLLFAAGIWIVLQPMEMRGALDLVG